jgi:hypothetical protein
MVIVQYQEQNLSRAGDSALDDSVPGAALHLTQLLREFN